MLTERISANHLKEISKLRLKKYRDQSGFFLVETEKVVLEALKSDWDIKEIYFTQKFISERENFFNIIKNKNIKAFELKTKEFRKISNEVTPQGICALVKKKELSIEQLEKKLPNIVLSFENISDPNNLGAILRTADWFGIDWILLSKNTVDFTNPKVIRASMGSIFHLNLISNINMPKTIKHLKSKGYKVYSTSAGGKSVMGTEFLSGLIIVFGNESRGISDEIKRLSDEIISIPGTGKAESLNVTISSSLILFEIWKKTF